ncbi:VOC family protein [Flavitalea sp.]|nr:VOC family protein [Flavitalea sp.]
MSKQHGPTFGNGKICYIEIPAVDVEKSAAFYHDIFGWEIRRREDGTVSFDDSVFEVSGSWVTGRDPQTHHGICISLMVSDMEATLKLINEKGGNIIKPAGGDLPEITALFSDPAGNIFSLYQHRF